MPSRTSRLSSMSTIEIMPEKYRLASLRGPTVFGGLMYIDRFSVQAEPRRARACCMREIRTAFSRSNNARSNGGLSDKKGKSFFAKERGFSGSAFSRCSLSGEGCNPLHHLLYRAPRLQGHASEAARVRHVFARPPRPTAQRSGRIRLAPDAGRTQPGT